MKKIITGIFAVFMVIGASFVIKNVKADNRILIISNKEVEKSSTVLLNIDLSSIEYTNSNIKITSSEVIEDVTQQSLSNVSVENQEIEFNYDKTVSNINNAIFEIKLSDSIAIGTKVNFKVNVTNVDDSTMILEETELITIVDSKTQETTTANSNNNENINNNNVPSNNESSNDNVNVSNKSTNNNATTQSKGTNNNSNMNSSSNNVVIKDSSSSVSNQNQNVYNGSTNNYLKSLSVSGYEFSNTFRTETNNYFITVGSDVDKVTVNAKASSSLAKVTISGNKDLKTGLNKILISVTSQSGDIRYYRIYVTKE